ncbi:B-lymphocyte antigen CD19-like isoform X2 [Xenopus laevis]|uniref:B-lymphocyte antigen CD19-like isoform X2 n=1 Tax=Xenopus laevis TaxID=8355 RepID=A0A8J1LVX2_XENLA|nr:B-lymphocyte antigen CD19-like isoform X2 [Xenopus laevis]OCT57507.1 hypothetical protein XELAEV_18003385mg [Xenopus laevis]
MMYLLLLLCMCVASSPEISLDTTNMTVPMGGVALLPCKRINLPLNIMWKMEDGGNTNWMKLDLLSKVTDLNSALPSDLFLRNFTMMDSGIYDCTSQGQKLKSFLVKAKGKEQHYMTGMSKSNISLPCRVAMAGKSPTWLRRNRKIMNDRFNFKGTELEIVRLKHFDQDWYSCFSNGSTSHIYLQVLSSPSETPTSQKLEFDIGDMVALSCNVTHNWTQISWLRDSQPILSVERGIGAMLHQAAFIKGVPYLVIPSATLRDVGMYHCFANKLESRIWLNVGSSLPTHTGMEMFLKGRYWIIVAVAVAYMGFCSLITICYMLWRQKEEADSREAQSRFYKVSTVKRNVYFGSRSPKQDTDPKAMEMEYQNMTQMSPKGRDSDCYSDKSSFLGPSEDGGSYLEPNVGDTNLSDGDSYENADQELDAEESSEDGECYENASEEMKFESERSQSYEDMEGSLYLKKRNGVSQDENKLEEEDADSYENMETPVYALPHQSSMNNEKTAEEQPPEIYDDRGSSHGLSINKPRLAAHQ